jgi:hypothetical protein
MPFEEDPGGTQGAVPRGTPDPRTPVSNGRGTAGSTSAMILGILAVVLCWMPWVSMVSWILAVTALPLGLWGLLQAEKNGGEGRGAAIAGIILALVALSLPFVEISSEGDGTTGLLPRKKTSCAVPSSDPAEPWVRGLREPGPAGTGPAAQCRTRTVKG